MNLAASTLLSAFGWTLLHFLWQGALVALILWCLLALTTLGSARLRYAMCCFALTLLAALPVATFLRLAALASPPRDGIVTAAPWIIDVAARDSDSPHSLIQQLATALDVAAPALPWIWLTGVAFCIGRLVLGLSIARRLRASGISLSDPAVSAISVNLANRLHLHRAVRLLQSACVEVPTVIGWLRPAILLPACSFTGLTSTQIEALLAHELAHIRRQDYLVSVIQGVVESLLFYHPAVWWVSRQIRRERECCCDDVAAAVAGNPLEYARALSLLEERRSVLIPAVPLAANGGVLSMRIKRVLGYRQGSVASQSGAIAILVVIAASTAGLLLRSAHAQTAAPISAPHLVPAVVISEQPAEKARTNELTTAAGRGPDATLPALYATWLNQDALWIITPQERAEFVALSNNQERDAFIKNFWMRRDFPGAPANSYKAAHYQRIAYSNQHFAENTLPGWHTDRGHAFIAYGAPESIDSRPSSPQPSETWNYRFVPGMGNAVKLDFVDTCACGHYVLSYWAAAPQTGANSRPPAVNAPTAGVLSGVVIDPTGALVPRATVAVNNGQSREVQQTDNTGAFNFSLPAGTYTLEVNSVGFNRIAQQDITVDGQHPVQLTLKLKVGGTSQFLTVSSHSPAAAVTTQNQPDNSPLKVSNATVAGNLLVHPAPVYPPDAKAAHVTGTVVLHALVSKTGDVEELTIVSGPEMLQASALDAVRQWKYKPYLLNGNPIEVDTEIRVNFTLGDPAPSPTPGASIQPGRPLRVSAGVMAGQAILQAAPTYPPDAKAAGIQGTVVLHALIGKNGDVEDLTVISGPGELTQSAVDAVKQWKYKPFLLNGEPVEIETTINVNYTLAN